MAEPISSLSVFAALVSIFQMYKWLEKPLTNLFSSVSKHQRDLFNCYNKAFKKATGFELRKENIEGKITILNSIEEYLNNPTDFVENIDTIEKNLIELNGIDKSDYIKIVTYFEEYLISSKSYSIQMNFVLDISKKIHKISDDVVGLKSDLTQLKELWFDNKEIMFEQLVEHFGKAKSSWLNQKYIPSLHSKGIVNNVLSKFVLRHDTMLKDVAILNEYNHQYKNLIAEIDYYLTRQDDSKIIERLIELKEIILQRIANIYELENSLMTGLYNNDKDFNEIDYYSIIKIIKAKPVRSKFSISQTDIERKLENIASKKFINKIKEIIRSYFSRNLVFLGDAGTGKTHGLANFVEDSLNRFEPSLLIQAKSINHNKTWKDIIIGTLGLSNHFSEYEIFNALEAIAIRIDVKNSIEEKIDVPTKITIYIDGIDESRPITYWLDRLKEFEIIQKKHKRLQLVFSSRYMEFLQAISDPIYNYNFIYLPYDGDVPVYQLYNDYVVKYNVISDKHNTIKWLIKTPYELKLFCEVYENKQVPNDLSIGIANLLKRKIKNLDNEICEKLKLSWAERDNVLYKILTSLANYFIENSPINYDELLLITINSNKSLIDGEKASMIINYLVEYGLLNEWKLHSEDPLEPESSNFEYASRPISDYLLGRELYIDIVENNNMILSTHLMHDLGTLRMASLILFDNKEWLIGTKELWEAQKEKIDLPHLQMFVLSNSSNAKVKSFLPKLTAAFKKSKETNTYILNELILKVSRISGHFLGPNLLHSVLNNFDKVSDRDLIWSVPDYLNGNNDDLWSSNSQKNLHTESNKLIKEDFYNGMPLIYAWCLTSVDNTFRLYCRKELTLWGLGNPSEYLKLLNLTFTSNDPQMKEDLLCIAYSIVLGLESEQAIIKNYANWVIENILNENKIKVMKNVIIRHSARVIIEKAVEYKYVPEDYLDIARPPYSFNNELLELDLECAKNNQESYEPIWGDLAWYVVKDGYKSFFVRDNNNNDYDLVDGLSESFILEILEEKFGKINSILRTKLEQKKKEFEERNLVYRSFNIDNLFEDNSVDGETNEDNELELESILKSLNKNKEIKYKFDYYQEADDLLMQHAKAIGLETLSPHQFALAAAISFINKLGWNKEQFKGKPNGGKPDEVLGVDSAIFRLHHPARHGSRSQTMQFSEKYLWCAVHEMMGYLSDRLLFHDHFEGNIILYDYILLLDIPNTLQEAFEVNQDKALSDNQQYMPNDISPTLGEYDRDEPEVLKKWILNAPYPTFLDWLIVNNDFNKIFPKAINSNWLTLNTFTDQSEPITNAESLMWVSAILIDTDNWNTFFKDLDLRNSDLINILHNPESIKSNRRCDCYLTPNEICTMPWREEYDLRTKVLTIKNEELFEYYLYPTVIDTCYDIHDQGEIHFCLPSKTIRNILNINKGDGWNFYSNNNLTAFGSIAGEKWRDYQKILFVNKDKLLNSLDENKKRIFWSIRILREPSLKSRDKYDYFIDKDVTYIVWLEGDTLNQVEICSSIRE